MKFTISRSSDFFMDCVHPNKDWAPHKRALWSEKNRYWHVDVENLSSLIDLLNNNSEKLIITLDDLLPHVCIDDVGDRPKREVE